MEIPGKFKYIYVSESFLKRLVYFAIVTQKTYYTFAELEHASETRSTYSTTDILNILNFSIHW